MFRTKPGEERALIEDWINRPALRKLVEAFGGAWPTGSLEEVVAQLVEFSEVWDYRAGKHDRHMFHEDQGEPDPYAELTYWAAEELGMINPPPPSRSSYDYLLILGGLATGVEPRVQYAAKLIEDGLEVRKQIAALGSFRELQERELPIASKYAPEGRYEIDHLGAMLDALFGSGGSPELQSEGNPAIEPRTSSFKSLQNQTTGPSLASYAAASSDPLQRPANTADTYDFVATENHLQVGDCTLIVTSSIYLPYQHIDAVRTLCRLGLDIESVGVRPGTSGPSHSSTAYRQEARSAIRSAEFLLRSH